MVIIPSRVPSVGVLKRDSSLGQAVTQGKGKSFTV